MMDNASALPTCPQRQHQQQTADRNWPENRPHDFTLKQYLIIQLLASSVILLVVRQ
jgi:hypothetical protein